MATEFPDAPDGWTQEHQDHLDGMMAARMAEDEHIRWLVSKELETFLPEYIETEEQAAELVRLRYDALQSPEADLAAIDKQIGEVEGACISWERKLTDSAAEMRVEAHRRFADWSHELDLLHADREQLERELEPLRGEYQQAVAKLRHATTERETLEVNISDFPYWGLGHKTDAYQYWRADSGHLIPVLLRGEEGVQEWDAAITWMDHLCLKSGYRTDHLPTNAEQYKQAMENYAASVDAVQPAPTMTGIMGQTQAYAKSLARVPDDHWEYAPQVNPLRVQPDPSRAYQPLRNIRGLDFRGPAQETGGTMAGSPGRAFPCRAHRPPECGSCSHATADAGHPLRGSPGRVLPFTPPLSPSP